jgi:hypothetical protein
MTDRQLWGCLISLLKCLDPGDPLYDVTQARRQARHALDVCFELQERGTQLPLFSA